MNVILFRVSTKLGNLQESLFLGRETKCRTESPRLKVTVERGPGSSGRAG